MRSRENSAGYTAQPSPGQEGMHSFEEFPNELRAKLGPENGLEGKMLMALGTSPPRGSQCVTMLTHREMLRAGTDLGLRTGLALARSGHRLAC
jgi:hypothetical protein